MQQLMHVRHPGAAYYPGISCFSNRGESATVELFGYVQATEMGMEKLQVELGDSHTERLIYGV